MADQMLILYYMYLQQQQKTTPHGEKPHKY